MIAKYIGKDIEKINKTPSAYVVESILPV